MQANGKIIILLILLLLMLLMSGCEEPQGQMGVVSQSESVARQSSSRLEQQTRQSQVVKRFQEPAVKGQTAVESAMQLSEKYAKVYEEAVALREKNQTLVDENHQLKERISVLDTDLKKTQKELTEANDLLIEMRIELNNWKMDVIGFRDEIRQAESAQLEALLKILKILGGEVTVESAQSQDKSSTAASSAESAQKSQNTLNRSEPNE